MCTQPAGEEREGRGGVKKNTVKQPVSKQAHETTEAIDLQADKNETISRVASQTQLSTISKKDEWQKLNPRKVDEIKYL